MIVTGYRRQCEMHMPSLGILNLTHLLFGVQMYVAAVQEASGGGGGGKVDCGGEESSSATHTSFGCGEE